MLLRGAGKTAQRASPFQGTLLMGAADALRAVCHLEGPWGLRNKELLAELSAAPGRSATCRYGAVAHTGLRHRLGDPLASHQGIWRHVVVAALVLKGN